MSQELANIWANFLRELLPRPFKISQLHKKVAFIYSCKLILLKSLATESQMTVQNLAVIYGVISDVKKGSKR